MQREAPCRREQLDVPETSSDEESEAEVEELELKRRATASSVTKTREKWIEKTIFVKMQIGSHPLGSPYIRTHYKSVSPSVNIVHTYSTAFPLALEGPVLPCLV
jgi:hypothetical protein